MCVTVKRVFVVDGRVTVERAFGSTVELSTFLHPRQAGYLEFEAAPTAHQAVCGPRVTTWAALVPEGLYSLPHTDPELILPSLQQWHQVQVGIAYIRTN